MSMGDSYPISEVKGGRGLGESKEHKTEFVSGSFYISHFVLPVNLSTRGSFWESSLE